MPHPRSFILDCDVTIPLRDGVVLRCDIARPDHAGKWPVIIMQSPYGKEHPSTEPLRLLTEFARKGFVMIFVDTRARYASDGEEFQAFVGHDEDGADTVAWAAVQPWSDGNVFGLGPSYHGFTQWAAATTAPSALKAFSPWISPSRATRTMLYYGGALELAVSGAWWMMMGEDMIRRRYRNDQAALEAALAEYAFATHQMFASDYGELPLGDYPPMRRAGVGNQFLETIRHGHGSGTPLLDGLNDAQSYEKIKVPALIVGGWYDLFSRGSIDQFVGMCARGGSEQARLQTRLIIGPWDHSVIQSNIVGERDFGMSASGLAMPPHGLTEEVLNFFRDTVEGKAITGPRVKLFVMGANAWRDEQEWPLARTQITSWYLSSGGNANSLNGDGEIGPVPLPSPPDTYVYDPAAPVPTHGGNSLWAGLIGPRDQRPIEARADVLVYTSQPLEQPLEVTGTAVVELWVETDVVDSDFVAKLVDVQPDGTAYQVAEGIQRARWRSDPEMTTDGTPLPIGTPTLISIELTPTSNLFLEGHRLRLDVTSSNFPRWARNLNIWNQLDATLSDAKIANHRVHHDEEHQSRVLLPVIPSR